MPLRFQLRETLQVPLHLESLTPCRIASLAAAEIETLPLRYGRDVVSCGDLFDLSGSAIDDQTLEFAGDLMKTRALGMGMEQGTIHVLGSAGHDLGAGMSGGEILIEGHAGDWVGAKMRGGRIQIQGNMGDFAGAARPGCKMGMRGGELFVFGNAGRFVGQRMRRGLIAIAGDAGEGAGAGMISGTLLLQAGIGQHLGIGMKRGTIIAGNESATSIPFTFATATTYRPAFLSVLLRYLDAAGFPIPPTWHKSQFRCLRGDRLTQGLGEILLPVLEL